MLDDRSPHALHRLFSERCISASLSVALVASLAALSGCAQPRTVRLLPTLDLQPIGEPGPVVLPGFSGDRIFRDGGIYFAGQPSAEGIREAAARRILTVINLRPEAESEKKVDYDERATAAREGMEYLRLPITPASFSRETVDRFAGLLAARIGPVLVHCSSANRAGGLWAAYLALRRGVPVADALRRGRAAGLSKPAMVEAVKRVLREAGRAVEGRDEIGDGEAPALRPSSLAPQAEHAEEHGHAADGATIHRRFDDAELWASRFESPGRDEWQLPQEVVELMALRPDSIIADIGSATGYFPVRFARAAPAGRVYGVDIEPHLVNYLNLRAQREGLTNLVSLVCTESDPAIPEPVDRIFICDTYHHIGDRVAYFRRLREDLRPGGRLVVVDFRKGDLPVGPPDRHKLAPEQVIEELERAGWQLRRRGELPYQYALVFAVAETP